MSDQTEQELEATTEEKYSAPRPGRRFHFPISFRQASFSDPYLAMPDDRTEPIAPPPPSDRPAPLPREPRQGWLEHLRPIHRALIVGGILVLLVAVLVPMRILAGSQHGSRNSVGISNHPSSTQEPVLSAQTATPQQTSPTPLPGLTHPTTPAPSPTAVPGQPTPSAAPQPSATPGPTFIRIMPATLQQYTHGCSADFQIRSTDNGLYVSAEMSYTGSTYAMLRARSATVDIWERYNLSYDATSGTWSIQSTDNKLYASTELQYTGTNYAMMRARSATVGIWEQYNLYYNTITGAWSIQSNRDGLYISAEMGYTGSTYAMLRARAATIGPWEQYALTCGA